MKSFEEFLDFRELTGTWRDQPVIHETPFTKMFWDGLPSRTVNAKEVELIVINGRTTPGPGNVAGGAARVIEMSGANKRALALFRYFTELPLQGDALKALRELESFGMQEKGREIVELALEDSRLSHALFREVVISNTYTVGRVCLDVDGNILTPTVHATTGVITNPAGTVISADFGVPNGNRGDLGGLITALWDVASTKIIDQVEAIQRNRAQNGLPRIKRIILNSVNKKHLRNNTQFGDWLKQNGLIAEQVMRGGILEGFADLTWEFNDGAWTDAAGTSRDSVPLTSGIMIPANGGCQRNYRGTELVPSKIGIANDMKAALASLRKLTGMFAYASLKHNPVQLSMFTGDNFACGFASPDSILMPTLFS